MDGQQLCWEEGKRSSRPLYPNVGAAPTRQGLLGSLGGPRAEEQGWSSLHLRENIALVTEPLSVDPPFSPGPKKPVWRRLGKKLDDVTQIVYGPGSSEITPGCTLTSCPWRGKGASVESPGLLWGTQPAQQRSSFGPGEIGQVGGPSRRPQVILRACAQKTGRVWGAGLAQWVEHATLDIRV